MAIPLDDAFKKLNSWIKTVKPLPFVDFMALNKESPWKILAATALSARTKDSVAAKASQRLFDVADTPQKTAELSSKEIEKLIYPVGFYRTKALNLKRCALLILSDFNGRLPETVEELTTLPGVGIKTASLVFIKAFDGEDICVDAHVHRIANMWRLVETKSPDKTRIKLKEIVPKKYWKEVNGCLVALGQTICRPLKRECNLCPLNKICPASNDNHV